MNNRVQSQYNFTTRADDGTVILYNAASGKTLYFTQAEFNKDIKHMLECDKVPVSANETVLAVLMKGGFIRRSLEEEKKMLRDNYVRSQYAINRMSMTIVPSQECNFSCDYCYERDRSGLMSDETARDIVEFCRGWIYPKTDLSICWYGGEPLLAFDRVRWLSEKLRSVADEKNCTYSASIITNGYLLDSRTAADLLRLGVTSAQITIDGNAAAHDRYRRHISGKPTYRKVFGNLIASAKEGMFINVRVNVGKHNAEEAFAVFDELASEGLQQRVSVSFGFLDDMCGNSPVARKLALSPKAFSRLEYIGYLHKLSRGFRVDWGLAPRHTYCSAVRPSFLMISHDGKIHKCWNRAGNTTDFIGLVSEASSVNAVNDPFIKWDPLSLDSCCSCRHLPLCMGGCPDQAMRNPGKNMCSPIRYNLEKILQLRYMWESVGFGASHAGRPGGAGMNK